MKNALVGDEFILHMIPGHVKDELVGVVYII